MEDINQAIECQTQVIQLTPEGHDDMPDRFNGLGTLYLCRFERLGEPEDINWAIKWHNRVIQLTRKGHANKDSLF